MRIHIMIAVLMLTACEPQGRVYSNTEYAPTERIRSYSVLDCSIGQMSASLSSDDVEISEALTACTGLSDDQFIEITQKEVSRRMKDPSSVQYESVYRTDPLRISGRYNAKNSYGAYIGFKSFEAGISAETGKWYSNTY